MDVDGKKWHLNEELKEDKTVLLDFFYADCVPCQDLTPQVADICFDYGLDTGNVLVLGISDRDNNAKIKQFESDYGVNYPSCGIEGNGDSVTSAYQSWFPFKGWPTYAVICPNGLVHWDLDKAQNKLPVVRSALDSCIKFTGIDDRRSKNVKVVIIGDVILLQGMNSGRWTIRISDISGRRLVQVDFQEPVHEKRIDLSAFQSGIYIYSLSNGRHQVTGKFIKMK